MLLSSVMTEIDSSLLATVLGGATDADRAYYAALGREDDRCARETHSPFRLSKEYGACMQGAEGRARAASGT